jgi:hypothetical protein
MSNPTPAYSPESDRRRLAALVKIYRARKVQAPMPQISGTNSQNNAARRKWKMEHLTCLSAPLTDSRHHLRIVNGIAEGSQ